MQQQTRHPARLKPRPRPPLPPSLPSSPSPQPRARRAMAARRALGRRRRCRWCAWRLSRSRWVLQCKGSARSDWVGAPCVRCACIALDAREEPACTAARATTSERGNEQRSAPGRLLHWRQQCRVCHQAPVPNPACLHSCHLQEVEKQYKEGSIKAVMVQVLKAVKPEGLGVAGECAQAVSAGRVSARACVTRRSFGCLRTFVATHHLPPALVDFSHILMLSRCVLFAPAQPRQPRATATPSARTTLPSPPRTHAPLRCAMQALSARPRSWACASSRTRTSRRSCR